MLPTLTIEIPAELEQLAHEMREAVAEGKRVRRILQEVDEAIVEARRKLAIASSELQAAEGAVALGKASDASASQKRFLAARNAVDFALARRDGVAAQLTVTATPEEAARERLYLAWQRFALGQIDAYHDRYKAAVRKFQELIDEGIAISIGLNGSGVRDVPRLQARLERLQILGSREEKEYFRVKTAYEQNGAAVALRDELLATKRRLFGVEG